MKIDVFQRQQQLYFCSLHYPSRNLVMQCNILTATDICLSSLSLVNNSVQIWLLLSFRLTRRLKTTFLFTSQYSSLLLVAGFITKQLDRMLSAFAGYFCVIDFFILKFLLSLNLVDGSKSCYVSFRKWRHSNLAMSRKKLVDVFVVYGMNLYFLVFCFHIAFLSFIIVAKIR